MRNTAIFISGRDFNLYRSRLPVMRELLERGWRVIGVSSETDFYKKLLNEEGVVTVDAPFHRHGLSLRNDFIARKILVETIQAEKPSLVHCFNPKPILLLSSLKSVMPKSAIKFVTVTGTGFVADGSLKSRIITRLYLQALKKYDGVFYENSEDWRYFHSMQGLVGRCSKIQISSGVDTNEYIPSGKKHHSPVVFLFASRLLTSKGLYELLDASKILHERYAGKYELQISGEREDSHRERISNQTLAEAEANGLVKLLGHVSLAEMPRVIGEADVVVLPSYREGFSKLLMEGASAGKALIASDIAGCREAIENNVNGFLVIPKDVASLVESMSTFIEYPMKIGKFGAASRQIAINRFDSTKLALETLEFYEDNGVIL